MTVATPSPVMPSPPPSTPPAGGNAANGDAPFARELQQARADAADADNGAAAEAGADRLGDRNPKAKAADAEAKPGTGKANNLNASKRAGEAGTADPEEQPDPSIAIDGSGAAEAALDEADRTVAGTDPALLALLQTQLAQAQRARADGAGSARAAAEDGNDVSSGADATTDTDTDNNSALSALTSGAAARGPRSAADRLAAGGGADGGTTGAHKPAPADEDARAVKDAGLARADLQAAPAAADAAAKTSALPSFAAELARAGDSGAVRGGASPAAAAAAAELHLATPVESPAFVPRLGGEIAVLARDGVQEARIQLHPAELGPISVQIALDGNSAQVQLAVDNERTRSLLEQGMPSLAAAMREAGLTLTGGGVFQQQQQSSSGDPGAQGRNGAPSGGADNGADPAPDAAASGASRRARSERGLDVYA